MLLFVGVSYTEELEDPEVQLSDEDFVVEEDLGKSREGSRTDDEVVQRFVTAIHLRQSVALHSATGITMRFLSGACGITVGGGFSYTERRKLLNWME